MFFCQIGCYAKRVLRAVFDLISFSLDAHLSGFFGTGFAIQHAEIIIGDGFGVDKAAFKVTVEYACCLWHQ